jgi:hypothetical protein
MPNNQTSRFFPRILTQVATSFGMARWGNQAKTLDISAYFHSAPFPLMARCADFPRIIEVQRKYLPAIDFSP